MATNRMIRVNELLRREISTQLFKLLVNESVDLAEVTVTEVQASPDLRSAHVMISVRGNEEEAAHILRALKRHRKEFQKHISRNVKMKYTPHLNFERDTSIERGDRVLHILDEIEHDEPAIFGEEAPPLDPEV